METKNIFFSINVSCQTKWQGKIILLSKTNEKINNR